MKVKFWLFKCKVGELNLLLAELIFYTFSFKNNSAF